MKKDMFFLIFLPIFIFLQTSCRDKSAENKIEGLELRIHCPGKKLLVGDEIPIVFTIINRSEHNYRYNIQKYDRSGRMSEYQLQAKDKKGNIIADPRENVQYGLGGVPRAVRASGSSARN